VAEPTPGSDPSLVVHYEFENDLLDSSGYGNNGTIVSSAGTIVGDPNYAEGVYGQALSMDGTDKYIDCGNDPSLRLTGEVTISTWVKMEPGNEDVYMGIAGKISADPYRGYALVRHSSNVFRMWVGFHGDLQSFSSDVTYNDTDWHHVVGVCDNGTCYLYVDGVQQTATLNHQFSDSGMPANVGKQYYNRDQRYWNGAIDDVRIYYRALSEQEIAGL
jgi:hypothetical protein